VFPPSELRFNWVFWRSDVRDGKSGRFGTSGRRRDWLKPGDRQSRRKRHDPENPGDRDKEQAMPRARWKMVVPVATLTLTSFTVQTAQAFFPPVGPPATVKPVSPPPFIVVPPVVPPPVIVVPPTSPPGSTVPEPSTMGGAIAGLTAAAGWAARRRKKTAAAA
jgi:hypothetical protein